MDFFTFVGNLSQYDDENYQQVVSWNDVNKNNIRIFLTHGTPNVISVEKYQGPNGEWRIKIVYKPVINGQEGTERSAFIDEFAI